MYGLGVWTSSMSIVASPQTELFLVAWNVVTLLTQHFWYQTTYQPPPRAANYVRVVRSNHEAGKTIDTAEKGKNIYPISNTNSNTNSNRIPIAIAIAKAAEATVWWYNGIDCILWINNRLVNSIYQNICYFVTKIDNFDRNF